MAVSGFRGKVLGKNGGPKGIRTPVTDVRGQCPRPLDDGTTSKNQLSITNEQLPMSNSITSIATAISINTSFKLTHNSSKIKQFFINGQLKVSCSSVRDFTFVLSFERLCRNMKIRLCGKGERRSGEKDLGRQPLTVSIQSLQPYENA